MLLQAPPLGLNPLLACYPLLLLLLDSAVAEDGSPSASPTVIVSMRAYFHADIRDYFLLQSLVPLNVGHYFCACLVTFALALGRVAIQVVTPRLESGWCDAEHYSSFSSSPSDPSSPTRFVSGNRIRVVYRDRLTRLGVAAKRGLHSTLSLLVSTLIMLILMSFNLGYFLAALLGHFAGVFFMSGWGVGGPARNLDPDCAGGSSRPEPPPLEGSS